jgi:ATP-binding cassette subfamily C protein
LPDKDSIASPQLRELFSQLWGILTPRDRLRGAFLLILILTGTCLEILGIGLIIPVVALLSQPDFSDSTPFFRIAHEWLGSPEPRVFILWALGGLLGIFIIKNAFLFLSIYWQTRILFNYQARLSGELMKGYLNRPYSFHVQHPTAELLQKINGEVAVLVGNVFGPILWIISESLIVLGLLALAIWVNPLGALVAMGGLGITFLAYYHLFKARVEIWGNRTQQHAQGMYEQLQHAFGGIKEVKIFGRESFFSGAFTCHAEGYVQNARRHGFLSQSSRQVIEILVISVLLVSVMMLVKDGESMNDIVPILAFYAAASFRLMPSVQRLLSNANNIRFGARSLRLLRPDLLFARAQSKSRTESSGKVLLRDELVLRNVTFRYPGGHEDVLRDINLNIPCGSMVGFQGQSGAGKTTLVDVILGLLEPDQGQVSVDGVSIHENISGWQSNIGYVPQSIFLIDETLRRNVAFGLEEKEIDNDRVAEVLSQAQLEDFVKSRPEGIETVVGERGVRLSGGQRQRIGIARALYHDPDILVLDEATASLDLDTEAEFIKAVESLKNQKTVLMISHRLSTLAECDSKYHLESGSLNHLPEEDGVFSGKGCAS